MGRGNQYIHLVKVLYCSVLYPDDPNGDPNQSQNLITCSLSHLGDFLKISAKSINTFLSYLSLKINFMVPEDPDSDLDHSQN